MNTLTKTQPIEKLTRLLNDNRFVFSIERLQEKVYIKDLWEESARQVFKAFCRKEKIAFEYKGSNTYLIQG